MKEQFVWSYTKCPPPKEQFVVLHEVVAKLHGICSRFFTFSYTALLFSFVVVVVVIIIVIIISSSSSSSSSK